MNLLSGAVIGAIIFIIIILFIWRRRTAILYFDNNATTPPHAAVVKAMIHAASLGNPAATHATAAKSVMDALRQRILERLGKPRHRCIITSGASESNNLLFRGFAQAMNGNCHIITTAYEHKTSLECIRALGVSYEIIDKSKCSNLPDKSEFPTLISIMAMNNETGDVFRPTKVNPGSRSWLHVDAAQYFGKMETADMFRDVDCVSISFHKMYGPVGIGALVVPHDFPMAPQIAGTQNDGLRGGTESAMLAAGALMAMEETLAMRAMKNAHLGAMRERLLGHLMGHRQLVPMSMFSELSDDAAYELSLMGPPKVMVINIPGTDAPINTLLVSFINNERGRRFCNIQFRAECIKRGVHLSIGSACNTAVTAPSHVLMALRLPFIVRCGVIRFSLGDYNTMAEVDEFARRCHDLI